jgi:hypothetical protein
LRGCRDTTQPAKLFNKKGDVSYGWHPPFTISGLAFSLLISWYFTAVSYHNRLPNVSQTIAENIIPILLISKHLLNERPSTLVWQGEDYYVNPLAFFLSFPHPISLRYEETSTPIFGAGGCA